MFASFTNASVLVVGDVMLDRYVFGDCQRISPEAPVPVVKVSKRQDKLGGAANVARNIAHLGGKVELLGVIGDDDNAELFTSILEKEAIQHSLCVQAQSPTTTKLRVISRQQQVVRVDFEERSTVLAAQTLRDTFDKVVGKHDVVIFSDYDKGALQFIEEMIQSAKKHKKVVLADPKQPDLAAYSGADVITPNLGEFIKAGGNASSESLLQDSAQKLMHKHKIASMLVTRSEKGMSAITKDSKHDIAAVQREVSDVTGAGDTVIATLAMGLAINLSFNDAAELANTAAGIAVSRIGAVAVHIDELAAQVISNHGRLRQSESEITNALANIQTLKTAGRKIVFTNGCFDVLHAGHVSYLERAKELGDYLIIGLNNDESVTRLKGSSRPVNTFEHRAKVLSGLRCVDLVLSFGSKTDDTPLQLITDIMPDVLVKGGDYTLETIVGAREVQANGGDVCIIEFVDNCSSTRIIEKLAETS